MKNNPSLPILLAAGLLLAGCQVIPVDVTAYGHSEIPAGFTVPVRPSMKLALLTDRFHYVGTTSEVQTGKAFREVFIGSENAAVTADVEQSSITLSDLNPLILPHVTYSARLIISANGKVYHISATHTVDAGWSLNNAVKKAVDRVVVDLARQAQALLAGQT